jgi:hypothetical protein
MSKLFMSIALLASMALAGCNLTTSQFLNSSDPCGKAENIHAAFLVFATQTPKVGNNAKAMRAERTAIASVRSYCASGEVSRPTLARLVSAYAEAVMEYRRNN